MAAASNDRSERQAKFFRDILLGKKKVDNVNDFKRFLECLFNQADHGQTVERLIASPNALAAVRNGLRLDITPAFLNEYTSRYIRYLDDPKIKLLCNGQFLKELLLIVVEPRTVWLALMNAFSCRELNADNIYALAWLAAELLQFPRSLGVDVLDDAQTIANDVTISTSLSVDLRTMGHKIKYLLQMKLSGLAISGQGDVAGGRHDNDFFNFREIAILPTSDESACTERPFYRRADEILDMEGDQRVAGHLENQFRLLRADMLLELSANVQIAQGKKKGRQSALRLGNLAIISASCHPTGQRRFSPFSIGVTWKSGLEGLRNMTPGARKTHLTSNTQIIKHKAFGCLLRGEEIVAFASIDRDVELLAHQIPVLKLQISGEDAFRKLLVYLKIYNDIEFLLVDAPIFAYEPILKRLQSMMIVPLKQELILYENGASIENSGLISPIFAERLEKKINADISDLLRTTKPVHLDYSQLCSLLAGLSQNVSIIQGPPGTGKSFIGALLAKAFHDETQEKILVMCYTNHALDQFLEDLLDIGIDASSIVRLGSKSSQRTRPLIMAEQKVGFTRSRTSWDIINNLENTLIQQETELQQSFNRYKKTDANAAFILSFLEFEDPEYFEALSVPDDEVGMMTIGARGQVVKNDYLYNRWVQGKDAGAFQASLPFSCGAVWKLSNDKRQEKHNIWIRALLEELTESLSTYVSQFNQLQSNLNAVWLERNRAILKSKRIIGCTTTAAAMYFADICQAAPGIVLVEEAGEILESHVLAAMTQETKQLVLIGDHLQLRPKVNSYSLTTEKGDGYDLNVSLFERLIRTGYPHTTLLKQHRMCPEISTLVRDLMYPELEDDDKTKIRPPPRGLQDRVIFIQHNHPEVEFSEISDSRDEGSKQSKRNTFEAELVLKIVKYLGQQGYGTDRLVVLTPYLGQLHLLRDELSKQNDPVLNDLDSYDLVRAGLISKAGANHSKRQIKISTIDNYQGEESEIVIASLTRSNRQGEIGFMAIPERVNVLLSRARDVLIMVGNSETFLSSRKGTKCWGPLLDQLKANGHIYDGLPIRCEQHPGITNIIETPTEFDKQCPDGGCSAPCGIVLKCGVHDCPSRCHQLSDHSQMECRKIVDLQCSREHRRTVPCSQTNNACRSCLREDQAQQRRRERDAMLDIKRQKKQYEYAQALAEAQAEVAHLKRTRRDLRENADRQNILIKHQQEIESLKAQKKSLQDVDSPTVNPIKGVEPTNVSDVHFEIQRQTPEARQVETNQTKTEVPKTFSPSENEWNWEKQFLNSHSEEIDHLMEMIGLEAVKERFLTIKGSIDASISQDANLVKDRFGTVFLGNPGTGKTTVARLYARFLASVGAIPGTEFFETTGARMANEGVHGCQKSLDSILEKGGGAVFIDEAYQLTQGSIGGTQVLDFLLAEVENLTGKVVFILAGYQGPMEKFFSHNIGLKSRFPKELKFNDYEDDELLQILAGGIEARWRRQMKIEEGLGGLYCRILARRIGSGRGKEGFGNARAVENAISALAGRQASRLRKEKQQAGAHIDSFFLSKEDLIGPEPSLALESSKAWNKLKAMIGLDSVKDSVQALLGTIDWNYQRELSEQPLVEYSLNKVFLGSPGTGKTTVAKLYGQLLVDIGMLSNGEVVVRNPSDFVGSVIGESEKNTKGILASTAGKVLVIDEAYGLAAVVDTIVAEVQSTPGEDRCVLLLGYKNQMQQLFQHVNPGLSRRFPMDQAFVFSDFTKEQMDKILTLKLEDQGFDITNIGRQVAMEMIERARNRLNYGNAGEIDILLDTAKMRFQKRISSTADGNYALVTALDALDFDEEFDRADRNGPNVQKLFEGVVGCENIIAKLEGYQKLVRRLRKLKMDPRNEIPFNFLFRGPPGKRLGPGVLWLPSLVNVDMTGTGKTSTARKMGQVYYDMNLITSSEVVEASATDLVGQYIGETGPKTRKILQNALGKVLFIDEAYRLADGKFGQEAMDELVDCLTKPAFFQKLIVVLAGYDDHIVELMSSNPGLTSRFSETLQFHPLSPDYAIQLLTALLMNRKKILEEQGQARFNLGALEEPSNQFLLATTERFGALSHTSGWANARDIESLAKSIFKKALQPEEEENVSVGETEVLEALDELLKDRSSRRRLHMPLSGQETRTNEVPLARIPELLPHPHAYSLSNPSSQVKSGIGENQQTVLSVDGQNCILEEKRDANVSDEIWHQLKYDKAAAVAHEQAFLELLISDAEKKRLIQRLRDLKEEVPLNQDGHDKRLHEQTRLQRETERREQEANLARLQREIETREEERRKEERKQRQLREMGACPVGYRWIKSSNGYRCAGGSHWVSDTDLA
ncbi:P-loop containing nucleoside triphosphate hydrolase protein [Penicillium atrosanguineum]|nr:P-loop containing nucleoside triphosphate hydrolase protein [Penicillium atrosanguineum]